MSGVTAPSGGVDDGGFGVIASAMNSVARSAAQIGQAVRRNEVAEGSKEAQDAFNKVAAETPAGEFVATPERNGGLLDRLGVKGAAYENTARLLTLQRAETDARLELNRIAAETAGNPQQFEARARGWASEYIGDAPPEQATSIERIIGDLVNAGMNKAVIERQNLDRQEARQGMNAVISALEDDMVGLLEDEGIGAYGSAAYQEKEARLVELLQTKANNPEFVYSEEQMALDLDRFADRMKLRAASVSVTAEINDALDYEGIPAAKAALNEIVESDFFKALTTADQKKLATAGQRAILSREAEIKRAQAEEKRIISERQTDAYNDILIGLIKGEAGAADIEGAFDDGNISKGQYVSLLQQTNKRDTEAEKLLAARDLVSSDMLLDPANSEHRDAIDRVFVADGGGELIKTDPAAGVDLAMAFTMAKGVIPKTAVTTIQAMVANGSTEQQAAGLDGISRFLEEAPNAARQAFKDNQIAEAVYYSDLASVAPQEFVMSSIMTAREAKFDGAAKEREAQAKKISKDFSRDEIFEIIQTPKDGFDPKSLLLSPIGMMYGGVKKRIEGTPEPVEAFVGGGAAVDAAKRKYQALFNEYYRQHGDEDRAKKQAAGVLKKHFGETSVLGRRQVMMYPPEAFYGVPGVKNDWMRKQLTSDVSKALGEDVKPENISIVSDVQTAAEVQSNIYPSYSVARIRDDGALEIVPGRFRFDRTDAENEAFWNGWDALYEAEGKRQGRIEFQESLGDKDIAYRKFQSL